MADISGDVTRSAGQVAGRIYGIRGPQGWSAYEVAVQEGYEGTEEEWLASLKGDPGDPGPAPVRGTDYWTAADQEAIEADLDDAVNDALEDVRNLKTIITLKSVPSGGSSGQVLRKASETNYNTEWADVASPTDEQVSAWLDDHPEATTTVEDGSLTRPKFAAGVLSYATPEMFGAVGDGATDDTTAIQNAINNSKIVVFSNKTYKTGQLSVTSSLLGSGATTLVCDSIDNNFGYLLVMSGQKNLFIRNLNLKSKRESYMYQHNNLSVPQVNEPVYSNVFAVRINTCENIMLENINMDGFRSSISVSNNGYQNNKHIRFSNCYCEAVSNVGIDCCEDIVFDNCIFKNYTEHTYSTAHQLYIDYNCDGVTFNNCKFINCLGVMLNILHSYGDGSSLHQNKNIKFYDCVFESDGYILASRGTQDYICNIIFDSCKLTQTGISKGSSLNYYSDVQVINCELKNVGFILKNNSSVSIKNSRIIDVDSTSRNAFIASNDGENGENIVSIELLNNKINVYKLAIVGVQDKDYSKSKFVMRDNDIVLDENNSPTGFNGGVTIEVMRNAFVSNSAGILYGRGIASDSSVCYNHSNKILESQSTIATLTHTHMFNTNNNEQSTSESENTSGGSSTTPTQETVNLWYTTPGTYGSEVITLKSDGGYEINGSGGVSVDETVYLEAGSYTLSMQNISGTATNMVYLRIRENDSNLYAATNSSPTVTFTLTTSGTYTMRLQVHNSAECTNFVFYPQLESGTTETSFVQHIVSS